jgi:hypothetical protein
MCIFQTNTLRTDDAAAIFNNITTITTITAVPLHRIGRVAVFFLLFNTANG